jgi:hypothetical protein
MDISGYDFRIQRAEIHKEDIKYFKQWNHFRPMLLVSMEAYHIHLKGI